MIISSTRTVETIIQVVSPFSTVWAGAAGAASAAGAAASGAGAGAAASGAAAAGAAAGGGGGGPPATGAASASPASRCFPKNFISICPLVPLERRGARLARPDAHGLRDVEDEDLPVTDLAGRSRGLDGLDRLTRRRVVDDGLEFHLGQEVDLVLRAPIDLGLALLPAISLDLRDRQTLHAAADKRFAHVVQLERFDDRHDEFHPLAPASGPEGGPNPSRSFEGPAPLSPSRWSQRRYVGGAPGADRWDDASVKKAKLACFMSAKGLRRRGIGQLSPSGGPNPGLTHALTVVNPAPSRPSLSGRSAW